MVQKNGKGDNMKMTSEMEHKRKIELLAYAKVCFERCTSPFAHVHLSKKNVDAGECRDLGHIIADLIDVELVNEGVLEAKELTEQAEIEFEETQKVE